MTLTHEIRYNVLSDERECSCGAHWYGRLRVCPNDTQAGASIDPLPPAAKLYQGLTKRALLIAYMDMKADEEDFHGVMDAAADLRELDAKANAR